MVVRNTKDGLWRAIEPALDVRESILIALAAGPEVNQRYRPALSVREEDVLRLQVAMNDTFSFHELQALAHLFRDCFHLLLGEHSAGLRACELLLLVQVQVEAESRRQYDNPIVEHEVVQDVEHAIMALVVLGVGLAQLLKEPHLDGGIVDLFLNVLANLGSVYLLFVSYVNAPDHLTEFALINCREHLEAIAELLASMKHVLIIVQHLYIPIVSALRPRLPPLLTLPYYPVNLVEYTSYPLSLLIKVFLVLLDDGLQLGYRAKAQLLRTPQRRQLRVQIGHSGRIVRLRQALLILA